MNQGSRCNNAIGTINNVDSWLGLMGGRTRQTMHDAFPMCAAFGVVAGVSGRLPIFLGGCGAQVVYQAGRHIFQIW
jgi:hypothetical protein